MMIETNTSYKRDEGALMKSSNNDEINDDDLDMLLEDLKMMDEEDISESDTEMK